MHMMNEMAIFAQVVDSGGFSAAARKLGLTTSAVSRHVTRLESHLGGRLLNRTTRSLALTELGAQVHAACVRMLSEAREIHALAGSYSASEWRDPGLGAGRPGAGVAGAATTGFPGPLSGGRRAPDTGRPYR